MIPVLVSLVLAVIAIAAIVSPVLVARTNNTGRARERFQDRIDRDKVASRVAEVAQTVQSATNVTNDKLEEIHVLVNSRLTDALNEIVRLREYLDVNSRPGDPPLPDPH